jgi:hypothetical protein
MARLFGRHRHRMPSDVGLGLHSRIRDISGGRSACVGSSMSAQVIPFRRRAENPYQFGTELWRAYERGAEATNEKWLLALVGKLPPKEARP